MADKGEGRGYELVANQLGSGDVAALCLGGMSPTLGIALSTPFMAASTGIVVPFAYLIGTVGVLAAAYAVLVLSRRSASAGVAFNYLGAIFGKRFGFLAGWLHSGAWLVLVPIVDAVAAVSLSAFLSSFHVTIPWFPLFLLLLAISFLLSYFGVRLSIRTQMFIELGSMLFITVVMLVVLFKGGSGGLSLAPFNPANGTGGIGGIGFGLLFAFSSFQGWEAGASLGKEAKDPHKSVPRGILGAILVSAVFFVIVSYGLASGFGVDHAAQWGKDSTPLGTIASRYTNSGVGSLTNLLVAISAFSDGLAGLALTSRVYHSMSSHGLGLNWLRRVHPRHKTPYAGIIVTAGVGFLLGFAFALPAGELDFTGVLTGANTIAFQLVYLLMAVGALWLFLPQVRNIGTALLRVGVPAVAIVLLGYAIYGSTYPPPPFPLNLAAPVFAVWVVIGLVLMYVIRNRGTAPTLDDVGPSAGEAEYASVV
ncbi:MAG: APC family permease [Candidatus Dormibacteria bacterium]